MSGSSCWTDLLPSSDENDELEEEEEEALDDSIERLLFSVVHLLNVFSCISNYMLVPGSLCIHNLICF